MGWPELLEEMEERLDAVARYLARGGPVPRPPAGGKGPGAGDPGPLPPELRERAEAVLGSTLAMEEAVASAIASVGTAMATAARVRPVPIYVDRRA